jgi:hypothetical protein
MSTDVLMVSIDASGMPAAYLTTPAGTEPSYGYLIMNNS